MSRSCVLGSTGGGSGGGGGAGTGTGCNPIQQTGCGPGEACMVTSPDYKTTTCLKGECDTVRQDCPNFSDKCTYGQLADGGVGRRCLPTGTKSENQLCSRSPTTLQDDCAEGLLCVARADGGNSCRKMCYTTTDCSPGGSSQCLGVVSPSGQPGYQLICQNVTSCDVLTQDCGPGEACYLLSETTAACFAEGTIAVGGDCSSGGLCVKGAMCIGRTCRNLCNADGGLPDCDGAECAQLAVPGGTPLPIGACQ